MRAPCLRAAPPSERPDGGESAASRSLFLASGFSYPQILIYARSLSAGIPIRFARGRDAGRWAVHHPEIVKSSRAKFSRIQIGRSSEEIQL